MAPAHCLWSRYLARLGLHAVTCAVAIALVAGCATRRSAPIEDREAPPTRSAPDALTTPPAATGGAPTPGTSEPDWRPPTYVVKRGDTLHGIALDYGLDYRDLAAWNGLDNANLILVGQVLRLTAPGDTSSAPLAPGVTTAPLRNVPPVVAQGSAPAASAAPAGASRNTDSYKSQPKLFKEPYSEQALREAQRVAAAAPATGATTPGSPPAGPSSIGASAGAASSSSTPANPPASGAAAASAASATSAGAAARAAPEPPSAKSDAKPPARDSATPSEDADRLQWAWPASGKVLAGFSETANLKGIDIGGAAGTPVVASAGGKVVYAGSGLRGYGKLIIVKHNATFLSAYAHNREILVKEGQQVARGQKIAEMGNTDANDVKLHFEIRRLGKPVDPLKYLPPA